MSEYDLIELLKRIKKLEEREPSVSGGGNGEGDMLKSTYDIDIDGVVDNSEKLEGSTKAQVQDHTPKAHTLASHSTKAHSELTDVTTGQHHTKYTDGEAKIQAEGAKLDDHAAAEDNTDHDATDELHGLMSKVDKGKLDTVAENADVTADNAPKAHKASHAVSGTDTIFPADPGEDKFLMWDDSLGKFVFSSPIGGGDVSVSGTPTAGQVGIWTDPTTIKGSAVAFGGAVKIASSTSTDAEKAAALASGGTVCDLTDDANDIHLAIAKANHGIVELGTGILEFDAGAIEEFSDCVIKGQGCWFPYETTKGTLIKLKTDADGIRTLRHAKFENLTILADDDDRVGTAVTWYIEDTESDRNMIPFRNVMITGGDGDGFDTTGTGLKIHVKGNLDKGYIELLDLNRVYIHGFNTGLHVLADAAAGKSVYINGITFTSFNITACVYLIVLETTGDGSAHIDGGQFVGLMINTINVDEPDYLTDDIITLKHGAASGGISNNIFAPAYLWDEDEITGDSLVAGTGCTHNHFYGFTKFGWIGAGLHNTCHRTGDTTFDLVYQPAKVWEGALGESGIRMRYLAGEAVDAGDLCYMKSDDKMWLADADYDSEDIPKSSGLLGIAIQDGVADDYMYFHMYGVLRVTKYAWGSRGQKIFMDTTPGAMTQTAPSNAGDIVRVVGHSINNEDGLFFNPSVDCGEHDGTGIYKWNGVAIHI